MQGGKKGLLQNRPTSARDRTARPPSSAARTAWSQNSPAAEGQVPRRRRPPGRSTGLPPRRQGVSRLIAARKRRRPAVAAAAALGVLALILGPGAGGASAAEPPIVSSWASGVSSTSASLTAQINPNGSLTTYHFDYITEAAYEANLAAAKEPFTGAARVPASDVGIGAGASPVTVTRQASPPQPRNRLPLPGGRQKRRRAREQPGPSLHHPVPQRAAPHSPTAAAGRWSRRSTRTAARSRRRHDRRRRRPAGGRRRPVRHLRLGRLLRWRPGRAAGEPVHREPRPGGWATAEHHPADLLGHL